jgi:hypothetical protein
MLERISPGVTSHFIVASVILYFQKYPGTAGSDAERGISGLPFTLTVDGAVVQTGTTGADGRIILEFPRDKIALLQILGSTYEIQVYRHLEPINSVQGVQRRLNMFGYENGAIDGVIDQDTDFAILSFQADNAMDTDGEITSTLQNQIRTQAGE